MRLEPLHMPDAQSAGVSDASSSCHRARAPVCGVGGFFLRCQVYDFVYRGF